MIYNLIEKLKNDKESNLNVPKQQNKSHQAMLGFRFSPVDRRPRNAEEQAPPGHYAVSGLVYPCPAGRYGASWGLSDAACSGPCEFPSDTRPDILSAEEQAPPVDPGVGTTEQ